MKKSNLDDSQKQNDKVIPPNNDEIKSLNESEELNDENLEKIAGGRVWGCNKTVNK